MHHRINRWVKRAAPALGAAAILIAFNGNAYAGHDWWGYSYWGGPYWEAPRHRAEHDWHAGPHVGPHSRPHWDPYYGWHYGYHYGPHAEPHHDLYREDDGWQQSAHRSATVTSTGTTFRFEDDLDDVSSEVSTGVNLVSPSAQASVFAKVDVTFGDDIEGVGGKVGMRYNW